jgi:hypothetical protein
MPDELHVSRLVVPVELGRQMQWHEQQRFGHPHLCPLDCVRILWEFPELNFIYKNRSVADAVASFHCKSVFS